MDRKAAARMPMYGWYNPAHLLQIGIRVGIATIFGEFLDRRELFGNRDEGRATELDPQHDYSQDMDKRPRRQLWLDFVADSGDGWDPTYAIARLLARESLPFSRVGEVWSGASGRHADVTTRQGEVVVLGGDQVYATASREEYRRRLIAPFEAAARAEDTRKALEATDLYAIPGNHDWYDGLNAFMGVFCARRPGGPAAGFGGGRLIGYRQSRQTRSYFALKLPHKWWLLGVDAQLSGYIDRGQIAFFDDVAQKLMEPGSNLILCTGGPSWAYVGLEGDADKVFRNHGYLESVVTGLARRRDREARGGNGPEPRLHNLRLVLTGDSHHYARYVEGEVTETPGEKATALDPSSRCYLTWGGGGAFLHPTHQLEDVSFEWDFPSPPPVIVTKASSGRRRFSKRRTYPTPDECRRLSRRLPLFGWDNPQFAALIFAVGLVVAWALAGTADLKGDRLPAALRTATTVWDAVSQLIYLLVTFPWFLIACLAFAGVLVYFSAVQRPALRIVMGLAHFVAHLLAFFGVFILVARFVPLGTSAWSSVMLVLIVAGATALLSSSIMGIYLWISLARFRRHWNEAFSALRIKDYKGFLRLHVDEAGDLTVYPIALDIVPTGDTALLNVRLIEPPIRIKG